jgi:hypothetical protein
MYRILQVTEKTKMRFKKALLQESLRRNGERVTQEDFINILLDLWEQQEAGVKP